VRDLLVEIFGLEPAVADERCADDRAWIDAEEAARGAPSIAYHMGCFQTAHELSISPEERPGTDHSAFMAEERRLLAAHRARILAIAARHRQGV
jgi:hypothetical protein